MKKYITFIPRQPEGKLSAQKYLAVDNQQLAYDKETRFPIVPMLHGYSESGETVQVIAVCEDYDNSRRNLVYLKEELDELKAETNVNIQLVVVDVPFDDDFESQLKTFQKLIDQIEDNDLLFACITYGSKPIPIVETMVLRYARLAKKNVAVRCVAYGQMDHITGAAKIFDVTALAQLDDILRLLAQSGVSDIQKSVNRILSL